MKMINLLLAVFCLVNSHIVCGIKNPIPKNFGLLEIFTDKNFAGVTLEQSENVSLFHGVSGTVSVNNPIVNNEQMSCASMYIVNKSPSNFNTIVVGWQVYPKLYKDNNIHLFGYWASQNFKKGCYNLDCPGFVSTEKSITLGQTLNQTSIIDGLKIELPLTILQDPNSKDWWINVNEMPIGYYPSSLFNDFVSANEVGWMGKTTNPFVTPTPPMGSGVLPDGVLGHASYFINLGYFDDSLHRKSLTNFMGQIESSNIDCYGSSYYYSNQTRLSLQFGGPGGVLCGSKV